MAVTDDTDEGELLMGGRRMAIPCVERLGRVLIEDVGVPIPRIPDLIAAVEKIAETHDTLIPIIGHAGDGNFHPLVTFDAADEDAAARAMAAFDDIMVAALDLGGTVTGEHGIGTLKATPPRHPARPRRHGPHPPHQGRPRPAGHPQPGQVGVMRQESARPAEHVSGTSASGAP